MASEVGFTSTPPTLPGAGNNYLPDSLDLGNEPDPEFADASEVPSVGSEKVIDTSPSVAETVGRPVALSDREDNDTAGERVVHSTGCDEVITRSSSSSELSVERLSTPLNWGDNDATSVSRRARRFLTARVANPMDDDEVLGVYNVEKRVFEGLEKAIRTSSSSWEGTCRVLRIRQLSRLSKNVNKFSGVVWLLLSIAVFLIRLIVTPFLYFLAVSSYIFGINQICVYLKDKPKREFFNTNGWPPVSSEMRQFLNRFFPGMDDKKMMIRLAAMFFASHGESFDLEDVLDGKQPRIKGEGEGPLSREFIEELRLNTLAMENIRAYINNRTDCAAELVEKFPECFSGENGVSQDFQGRFEENPIEERYLNAVSMMLIEQLINEGGNALSNEEKVGLRSQHEHINESLKEKIKTQREAKKKAQEATRRKEQEERLKGARKTATSLLKQYEKGQQTQMDKDIKEIEAKHTSELAVSDWETNPSAAAYVSSLQDQQKQSLQKLRRALHEEINVSNQAIVLSGWPHGLPPTWRPEGWENRSFLTLCRKTIEEIDSKSSALDIRSRDLQQKMEELAEAQMRERFAYAAVAD